MRRVSFILLAALLFSCGGAQDDTKVVLRLAHGLPVTHPVHRAMEFFCATVTEKSNGAMEVMIYPSQQLGSERELLELLQIGAVDITKVSSSVLEGFAPEYKILGLPYLFHDEAHKNRVLYGPVGERFLASSVQCYLRGLTFYDAGARSFYTKETPVRLPEDIEGLKIRTQESPVAMDMVRAYGGSATPISWGELYTALQQGIVDGAENNPPSFYLSRHYEICRYYSLNEHTAVPDVLLISTKTWNRLSAAQHAIVKEAAKESALVQKKLWAAATEEALAAVEKAGVTVIRPDREPFRKLSQDLYREYRDDPAMNSLLRAIEKEAP